MPLRNKPDHGDPLVELIEGSEALSSARFPFQTFLDELTEAVNDHDALLIAIPSVLANGAVDVDLNTIMLAPSFEDQAPVALDTPIQISFGSPILDNEYFDLNGFGTFTCKRSGHYSIRLCLTLGREGTPSEAILFARVVVNGFSATTSINAIIDDQRIQIPHTFETNLDLEIGDTVEVELYRDSTGANAGGIYAAVPTLAGWPSSPSALVSISTFSTSIPPIEETQNGN